MEISELYIHEVGTLKELKEKSDALQTRPAAPKERLQPRGVALYVFILQEFLSPVNTASKVVDENDEPKVDNNGNFDPDDANIYHQEARVLRQALYEDDDSPRMAWGKEHPFRYDEGKSVEKNIAEAEKLAQEYLDTFGETIDIDTPERQRALYGDGAKKKICRLAIRKSD